ncbi:type IV pilus modification PilV family protein [Variovorax sp. VNK109]|jgi:type IV pilus assembly protein PilV|uniref:type IV pilus modification PilV family protein n=1 Tax=Variovorax sp. VNK109 TaxID=3400919 RepID=UPI003C00C097
MTTHRSAGSQQGSFVIEALVSLLIFSLGILAMMTASRVAISAQTDANIRTDAAQLANEAAQIIWLNVDRTKESDKPEFGASLNTFAYQPDGADCVFSGSTTAATSIPAIGAWLAKVKSTAGLPGSLETGQQIKVELDPVDIDDGKPAGRNKVTITLCWQGPNDLAKRQHILVTQVN